MVSNVNFCIVGLAVCASIIYGKSYKTLRDIVQNDGYEFEPHEVLTEDGYYLRIFRIRNKNVKSKWPPVLIVHGLGGSAADFILNFPNKSLGYLLSDEGFDVWFLSCRGTVYSEKHTSLKPTDSKFWNYSWHEIGIYDVPTTVDYILMVTSHDNLVHIGFSQGTTSFYVMLSERPEYNKKILAHISYSPITFGCHSTNALFLTLGLPEYFGLLSELTNSIGFFNFLPSTQALADFLNSICNCDGNVCLVCQNIAYFFLDMHRFENVTFTKFQMLIHNFPAGASVKQFIHYAQGMNRCHFRHLQNSKEYNLRNIKVPLFIFTAEKDNIQNRRDLALLQSHLPNGFNETITLKNYGHLDFITAYDAKEKIYDPTIKILKKLL